MGGGRTRVQVRTVQPSGPDHQSLTHLYAYDRPERWFNDIPGGNVVPGVWGNVLSFLGGPWSCIGYRFALVEYARLLHENTACLLIALMQDESPPLPARPIPRV
jgi:cytochrome P450